VGSERPAGEGPSAEEPAGKVGPLQVFTLSFGTVVGIAWVFLLSVWLNAAGPVGTAAAMLAGALATLPIALCYIRVVRAFPGSGGEIRYGLELFGGTGALVTSWLLFVAYAAVASFCVSAFETLAETSIRLIVADVDPGPPAAFATAGCFLLVAVANYRGIQTATWVQDLTVFLLIGVTAALAIAAFAVGRLDNLAPAFAIGEGSSLGGFAAVLATTPFLYAGFNTALQALGDLGPGSTARGVAGALLASLIAAAVFYAGIVVAITVMLPRDRLLSLPVPSLEAVGVRLGSPVATGVMALLAVLALVTSWNAIFFAASRVFALLAESGAFLGASPSLSKPGSSVVMIAIGSGLLGLAGSAAVGTVVTFVAASMTLVFLIVCAGLLRLELRAPPNARTGRRNLLLPLLGVTSAATLTILSIRELPAAWRSSPLGAAIISSWVLVALVLATAHHRRGTTHDDFRRGLQP
jgi:amino acid transporter